MKVSYRKETMLVTRLGNKIAAIIRNYRILNNPQSGHVLFIIKKSFKKRKQISYKLCVFPENLLTE